MSNIALATFAAGCFWGVEHYFKKEFGQKISTRVGYTGGITEYAEYKQVCTGATGHAEALEIVYDPNAISYEDLVTYFWRIHDPTTMNRQGEDRGTQYRSVIFYHSEEQRATAERVRSKVQSHFKDPIVTEIIPAKPFICAEDYHQNYLVQNPSGHCIHKLQW